jgi:hypothetical protein
MAAEEQSGNMASDMKVRAKPTSMLLTFGLNGVYAVCVIAQQWQNEDPITVSANKLSLFTPWKRIYKFT